MADSNGSSRPKSSIPAWQRAPISTPVADAAAAEVAAEKTAPTEAPAAATEDPVSGVPAQAVAEKSESPSSLSSPSTTTPSAPPPPPSTAAEPTTTSTSQPPPATRPSSTGLENPSANFNAVDVDHFKRSAPAPPPPPPIITYPEFLVSMHTPPPLITPTRLVSALYAGGGLAALLYGASKFVVEPLVTTLQGSRHEFYSHSRGKVEELNGRLEKLVSQVPSGGVPSRGGGVDAGTGDEEDELESITSDPTELYHRDIGTQTDLAPPASSAASKKKVTTEDPATAATTRDRETLESLTAHLTALADGIDGNATTARARLDQIQTLRHYLDTLTYASAGINVWSDGVEGGAAAGGARSSKKNEVDAIEELKKEIRSVKGVLLSAKRFPSYYGGGGRGQGMPVGMAPA